MQNGRLIRVKIAVCCKGKNVKAQVSEVFGRSPFFAIAEVKNGKTESVKFLDNAAAQQKGATGVSAAQAVAEEGVESVVAGNFGPRALEVFKQLEIAVYTGSGTVETVLSDFARGKLGDASSGRVKIAVPTNGFNGLKERVADHFGRCETYTFMDENGRVLNVVRNESEHAGGVGLPPEFLKKHGVSVLLCKDLGPRALELCKKLGIKVLVSSAPTVEKIFEEMKLGKAKKAGSEDVCEEHKS